MKEINYCLLFALMTLVFSCTKPQPEMKTNEDRNLEFFDTLKYNVAFVIMDGVYNTELTAPFDIFHHTIFRQGIKAMRVFTVAGHDNMVKTFEGISVKPDFNYLKDSLPDINILVIPSAEHNMDTDLDNEQLISFVRSASIKAEYVMSLCDGSFILAKAGVLSQYKSTTFPGDITDYMKMFPELTVIEGVSFVHDRKFITSAGGAASFDAALYLCEIMYGKPIADQLAKGMVIEWDLKKVKHHIVPTGIPLVNNKNSD